MKKWFILMAVLVVAGFTVNADALDADKTSSQPMAMEHAEHETAQHGEDKDQSMSMAGMDHSGHRGDLIRETTIDGYQVAYHLIDMREQMKKHGPTHGMKATHHLMIYVMDPKGMEVDGAAAGYMVFDPDNVKQQAMAMEMAGGYGADIVLSKKGKYGIKMKLLYGQIQLTDAFYYEMK